jgi:hypothetical protein
MVKIFLLLFVLAVPAYATVYPLRDVTNVGNAVMVSYDKERAYFYTCSHVVSNNKPEILIDGVWLKAKIIKNRIDALGEQSILEISELKSANISQISTQSLKAGQKVKIIRAVQGIIEVTESEYLGLIDYEMVEYPNIKMRGFLITNTFKSVEHFTDGRKIKLNYSGSGTSGSGVYDSNDKLIGIVACQLFGKNSTFAVIPTDSYLDKPILVPSSTKEINASINGFITENVTTKINQPKDVKARKLLNAKLKHSFDKGLWIDVNSSKDVFRRIADNSEQLVLFYVSDPDCLHCKPYEEKLRELLSRYNFLTVIHIKFEDADEIVNSSDRVPYLRIYIANQEYNYQAGLNVDISEKYYIDIKTLDIFIQKLAKAKKFI